MEFTTKYFNKISVAENCKVFIHFLDWRVLYVTDQTWNIFEGCKLPHPIRHQSLTWNLSIGPYFYVILRKPNTVITLIKLIFWLSKVQKTDFVVVGYFINFMHLKKVFILILHLLNPQLFSYHHRMCIRSLIHQTLKFTSNNNLKNEQTIMLTDDFLRV